MRKTNWKIIFKLLGFLLLVLSVSMLFPLLWSIYYQSNDIRALSNAFIITMLSSLLLIAFSNADSNVVSAKEGFIIVSMGWMFASIYGALPYFLHGSFGGFINCLFESMSGFTTTGATILTDIESIPKGLLFWRSLTHWLGGMGIILLAIAVLPFLGVNPSYLYNAEVPGPVKDRISPKIAHTAAALWAAYALLTLLEVLLLFAGGMPLYEAFAHSFGTMATGGFSTLNLSIGQYQNLYFEIIIIIFMYLAGTNFILHIQVATGNFKAPVQNREWIFYNMVLLISIVAISLNLFFKNGADYSFFPKALRDSAFQVLSITTTTGYATADFNLWPSFSKMMLIMLMFFGGCAGSTGGGIKQIRILILIKHALTEIKNMTYPNTVNTVKVGGHYISTEIWKNIAGFFILFLFLFSVITVFLALMGYDIVTSFSASIAALGNIGPGLARVGAVENYNFFDPVSKLVLIFAMMAGRLEIYSVLIFIYTLFLERK